ncbi:GMC family oxidoreductase [Marinobacterium aestuariivivens]|uniref:GMC family oxidoreductase n=1 Tax=Marinobacterium aestuariivivens TaxID=1698799 RepID=A0ABW2A0G3_9GAMM
MRRLQLNWQLNELDRHSFLETARAISAQFAQKYYARIRHPIQDSRRLKLQPLHSNHQLGTTRMAESSSQGVVDLNCRVHGIHNLYIASGSVFPTVSWANPTFTLMALSYRLAEHLRTELKSSHISAESNTGMLSEHYQKARGSHHGQRLFTYWSVDPQYGGNHRVL